jgi:hypothetical protein
MSADVRTKSAFDFVLRPGTDGLSVWLARGFGKLNTLFGKPMRLYWVLLYRAGEGHHLFFRSPCKMCYVLALVL